jgi:chorismate mutase
VEWWQVIDAEESLASARTRIDAIDADISTLLRERLDVACLAADAKARMGLQVFDADRERAVIERQGHHIVRAIFASIVSETREFAKRYANQL